MRNKNKIILFSIIAIILIFATSYFINGGSTIDKKMINKEICFKDKCFSVEVAGTDDEKEKGLMFRESLGEKNGMLFIYEVSGIYPFWMKNTLIPLDIIWLDESLSIVHIETVLPCNEEKCESINPKAEARYVLELNTGSAVKYNLSLGDKAVIK